MDREKLMLTREAICSGLNTIKSAYERCEEDHDIVYFVGEYGTGQVAHRVSVPTLLSDTIDLLEEQDELLRKLQKDKDKLCLEVSKWKHKFHDAPPKFVSQGVVDQIIWERDTALSQLEQIGKGLGSKMDDIVALLKEQEAVKPIKPLDKDDDYTFMCSNCKGELFCGDVIRDNFCPMCGRSVKWE